MRDVLTGEQKTTTTNPTYANDRADGTVFARSVAESTPAARSTGRAGLGQAATRKSASVHGTRRFRPCSESPLSRPLCQRLSILTFRKTYPIF